MIEQLETFPHLPLLPNAGDEEKTCDKMKKKINVRSNGKIREKTVLAKDPRSMFNELPQRENGATVLWKNSTDGKTHRRLPSTFRIIVPEQSMLTSSEE